MTDIVDRTLKLWRQSEFEYGRADCVLSVGDYLVSCGLPDALAPFRDTYCTEAKALAYVAAYGGPQGLLDLFRLPRIDPGAAVRGDVLVIDPNRSGSARGMAAALCLGDTVAFRGARGVREIARRMVALRYAWKVDRCHS